MAVGSDALKRTPLYDRHVAAGAKLVPFAGWEMPVQYAGIKDEHLAVRERAGVFDVSPHGRDRDDGPGRGGLPAAHPLQRRHQDRRGRGAVQRALQGGRRRPRRPLHVPARPRPLPDGHQRLQPREGPRLVPQAGRALRRRRSTTACTTTRCSRSRARGARHRRRPHRRRAAQALPHRDADRRRRRPDVLVCGTGYTGEDGVELLVAPEHATTVWDAVARGGRRARRPRRARHAAPGGLLSTSTATT